MSPDFDAVVVGAGVIGLAVARELALAGQHVIVLDKSASAGTETSSRNSEIIHAGIYYPTDSLKAQLCVEGHRLPMTTASPMVLKRSASASSSSQLQRMKKLNCNL